MKEIVRFLVVSLHVMILSFTARKDFYTDSVNRQVHIT